MFINREFKCHLQGLHSFAEFFSDYGLYNHHDRKFKAIKWGDKNRSEIGIYCQVRSTNKDYRAIEVMPSQLLIDYVKEKMLSIDYDCIDYELIIYEDDTAMLVAHYNQIIGSRWIAMIDLKTIPYIN